MPQTPCPQSQDPGNYFEDRLRAVEGLVAMLAERVNAAIQRNSETAMQNNKVYEGLQELRLDFTKLSTRVGLMAAFVGPIFAVILMTVARKVFP